MDVIERTRQETLDKINGLQNELAGRVSAAQYELTASTEAAQEVAGKLSVLAGENTTHLEELQEQYDAIYRQALTEISEKEQAVLKAMEDM